MSVTGLEEVSLRSYFAQIRKMDPPAIFIEQAQLEIAHDWRQQNVPANQQANYNPIDIWQLQMVEFKEKISTGQVIVQKLFYYSILLLHETALSILAQGINLVLGTNQQQLYSAFELAKCNSSKQLEFNSRTKGISEFQHLSASQTYSKLAFRPILTQNSMVSR